MSTTGKLHNHNDSTQSPLIGEHVKVKIFDLCSEVEIHQRFVNSSSSPLEVYYEFSIPEGAAVHNFLAIVGDARIETKLKEKEQAKDEYDDAIASGKTSVLLEQEGNNFFKTNIGNLAPDQECVTVISIVCELQFNDNKELEFTLQNDRTSPSYTKKETTGDNLIASGFKIDIDLEMTSRISSIQSTLGNTTTKSGNSVEISLHSEQPLEIPFQLRILLEEPNKPTFRVQGDVGMLSLYPQIELEDGEDPITEMIFLVDRSGSMKGPKISSAKDTLQIFLKSLPLGTLFNIIGFGSGFEFLFKNGSKEYDNESLAEAEQLVTKLEANLGGTELLPPLKDILSKPPKEGIPRQLFVLTDGEVGNNQECIDFVRKHANTTRVFAFGIQGASTALVNGIAKAGEGKAELIGVRDSVESKVMAQLKRALQPALTDIKVDWGSLQAKQTPFYIPPVFNGSRLILYGYIDSANAQAGNVTFTAKFGQKDYSFSLFADPQVKVPGKSITTLAARSMIRDLEEARSAYHAVDFSDEKIKEKIIELSLGTGVISKHTAFVGSAKVKKAPVADSMSIGFSFRRKKRTSVQEASLSPPQYFFSFDPEVTKSLAEPTQEERQREKAMEEKRIQEEQKRLAEKAEKKKHKEEETHQKEKYRMEMEREREQQRREEEEERMRARYEREAQEKSRAAQETEQRHEEKRRAEEELVQRLEEMKMREMEEKKRFLEEKQMEVRKAEERATQEKEKAKEKEKETEKEKKEKEKEKETEKEKKEKKEKEKEKEKSNLNLKDILIKQTATGTFPEETLKLLGTTLQYLREKAPLIVLQLSPVLADQILICVYVCGFIRLHYSHVTDQWELVVKKSVNWIKKECKKVEDPQNTLHNFDWLELGAKLASM